MCLELVAVISPTAKVAVSAKRLSAASGLGVTNAKFCGEAALHFSVAGGCSCEFLGDNADPESPEWALDAKHLPALASAVELLGTECRKFSLLAHWLSGEQPRTTEAVSRAVLVTRIRENRVGNNVLYRVG
ncbi:MAG: hypothetical protein AMXMBFR59_33840 [Rhodanobacteraceae bacterium]